MAQTDVQQSNVLALLHYFQTVRGDTEKLVKGLSPEEMVVQPATFVSPPKWHLAHTTWFFEEFILKAFRDAYKPFHPDFNFLFNSYYESMGERVNRTDRGLLTRPGIEEVMQYRHYVDQHMMAYIEEYGENDELITLGLHHEQQHQELLITDIKYILGHHPLFPAFHQQKKELPVQEEFPKKSFDIEEGLYEIGYDGPGFHYDNEETRHKVYLNAFSIEHQPVTNAEYMEFMADGGYHKFHYWLAEGWDWVHQHQVNAPMYWHNINGEWHYYTLQGLMPVDPGRPVTHLSYFEADAYAKWKGKRLPTEAEWEVACHCLRQHNMEVRKDPDNIQPTLLGGHHMAMIGEVWEWTASAYLPYAGFKPQNGALGEYNGKFMINQMVLRGGSCATPEGHIRPSYRNFFHPGERWQFTGIRLAE